MTMRYRPNYRRAYYRAAVKLGFYIHLLVFLLVNLFLLFSSWATDSGYWWSAWTLLAWGIGLAVHGTVIFGWESMMRVLVQQELKK